MVETKSVAIPVEDFHGISLPVAKAEQVTGKRIEVQLVGNQDSERIYRLAYVGDTGNDIFPIDMVGQEQQRFSSRVSTLLRVTLEKLSPTAMAISPGNKIFKDACL